MSLEQPTLSASGPPGRRWHAPAARLTTPDGKPLQWKRAGPGAGGPPDAVSHDIVSASVTLMNTGVGQAEIVLNNQRAGLTKPHTPPWRYNGLDPISFGTPIRIDMRYGDEPWTPMMQARVTDLGFSFPQAGPSLVTLKAEDLLSLLRVRPPKDILHKDSHEADMLTKELSEMQKGLQLAARHTSFKEPIGRLTHPAAMTHLKFFEDLATRMDYELFVDFEPAPPGLPGAAAPAPETRLHFEPARSNKKPAKTVKISRAEHVLEFKPAFKVWDQLTEAVAVGSAPGKRDEVQVASQLRVIPDEHYPAEGGAELISAPEARANAFPANDAGNSKKLETSNLTKERAQLQANAALQSSLREFLTAELAVVGMTALRPGMHVELKGYYAPFDGVYYVTKATHALSAAGYLTKLSLRRPGMSNPAAYPPEPVS
jgi:hypothetical protein